MPRRPKRLAHTGVEGEAAPPRDPTYMGIVLDVDDCIHARIGDETNSEVGPRLTLLSPFLEETNSL